MSYISLINSFQAKKWKSSTTPNYFKLSSSPYLATENPLWILRQNDTMDFLKTEQKHPMARQKSVSFGVVKYEGTTRKPHHEATTTDSTIETTLDAENSTGVAVKVEFPWPVKKEATVEGDLILGGLMMVHEREDSITCGPVMPQGGIQALEAMLYTLDRLNDSPLLPNITLGAHILDDCDKDTYGLEMAVDFIKGQFNLTH